MNFPLDIDKQSEPSKGMLLLSEPFLQDEHFSRSVILLCEHNEEGSFGFILNSSIDVDINDLIHDFPGANVKIGIGGPVEKNQLFYIHSHENIEGSLKVSEGIFMGGDFNALSLALEKGTITSDSLRFFIGYTGWSENQLQTEINEKTWVVLEKPSSLNVFHTEDELLWKELIQTKGPKYKLMSEFPVNPSDN